MVVDMMWPKKTELTIYTCCVVLDMVWPSHCSVSIETGGTADLDTAACWKQAQTEAMCGNT